MYFFDQRIGDSWKFYHVRVHILVDGVWSCNFQELKYSWVLQILTVFLWVFFGFGTRLDWASLVLSSILRVLTALSDDLTSVAKSKKLPSVGRPFNNVSNWKNCVGNLYVAPSGGGEIAGAVIPIYVPKFISCFLLSTTTSGLSHPPTLGYLVL